MENSSPARADRQEPDGQLKHYYGKINVATIKLVSQLKLNDKIIVIGKTTGILHSKISSMEIKNKPVQKANKPDEFGIKIPLARKNDEVYVIKSSH